MIYDHHRGALQCRVDLKDVGDSLEGVEIVVSKG